MTTFTSYGEVATSRQAEIIQCLSVSEERPDDLDQLVSLVMDRMGQTNQHR